MFYLLTPDMWRSGVTIVRMPRPKSRTPQCFKRWSKFY